jgi:hypothetical protein
MANYSKLIRLTPLNDFFFGGENTFGQDNTNYYVKSNYFPQQTSLLGMLRYELLKSDPDAFDLARDKVTNKTNAEKLIGTNGFSPQRDVNYGIIEGISPIFLLDKNGNAWFIDGNLQLGEASSVKLSPFAGSLGYNLLKGNKESQATQPGLMLQCTDPTGTKPWNGKDEFVTRLVGPNGTTKPLSEVFHAVKKTNNRKIYDGSTDESGFFKQEFWRLEPGWSFGFLAAFNADLPKNFGNRRQVHLGAERRFFALDLQDLSVHQQYTGITFEADSFTGFERLYQGAKMPSDLTDDQLQQLIALAPLFIHHVVSDGWNFAYIIKLWHRFMQTHLQDPNETFKNGETPKSALYSLADRGSSIWLQDAAGLATELQDKGAVRRIGYNYFKTL